jgi:BirA family transcriptional regulator, biotin operon repressor / biotin---[acetyl-CoA-carboxylase] ligase
MSRQVIGPVRHLDEIDSTNRYLADLARAGAHGGLVAIARYQTAGRGRLDRKWEAPPGANLLMSVLLRPPSYLEPFHLTVATALAASDACRETAGAEAGLKWPNDLVVNRSLDLRRLETGERHQLQELKLAGVLAELVGAAGAAGAAQGAAPAVVVGLGLNIGWPPPEPAEPEMNGATSLSRLCDWSVDPDDVAEVVLDHLDRRITDLFLPGGSGRQIEEYRARCVTIGRMVRVEEPAGTYQGQAERITEDGHLVVVSAGPDDDRYQEVTAGDVIHLGHLYAVWGRGAHSP